jgi:hypothetical protein
VADVLNDQIVDMPVEMQRQVKTMEKAYLTMQAELERLYEKAKKANG